MKTKTKAIAVFAVMMMVATPMFAMVEEDSSAAEVFNIKFYYDGVLRETIHWFNGHDHTVKSPTGMDGYKFDYWTAHGKTYNPGDTIGMGWVATAIGPEMYFYSVKTPKTYTAEFVNDGTLVETKTISYNSAIGDLPVVSKPGYNFLGWSSDGTESKLISNTSKYTFTKDMTFTPVWKESTFNVDLMDGSELFQTVQCTYNAGYGELPIMTKDGYSFMGWSLNPEGTMIVNESTVYQYTEDSKLYAVWAPITYTITFFDDGVLKGSQTVSYGLEIGELPTLSKKGMTFIGWSTSGDISGIVTPNMKYTTLGNTVLHAVWKANEYTATFESNGGTLSFETKTFNYGCTIGEFPVSQKEGYTLAGWSMSPDGKSIIDANTPILSDSDITLYAIWEKNQDINAGAPSDSIFSNPVTIVGLALVILGTIAASVWIYRKGLL